MINPKEIVITETRLIHKDKGEILVTGLYLHCGQYAVDCSGGWVYLSNCKLK